MSRGNIFSSFLASAALLVFRMDPSGLPDTKVEAQEDGLRHLPFAGFVSQLLKSFVQIAFYHLSESRCEFSLHELSSVKLFKLSLVILSLIC